jgi:hypothetical protein
MDRSFLFLVVVALSAVGGMTYPEEFRKLAMVLVIPIMPEVFPKSPEWIYFFAQVMIATGILLVSGVPAALYERLWEGTGTGSSVPMFIWLGFAIVLSLPALRRLGFV